METNKQIVQRIWKFIDEQVSSLTTERYLDVVEQIRDDAEVRVEGAKEELEDTNPPTDD